MTEIGNPAPSCELFDDAGRARKLAEFWANGPAAIVFVRHLGCPHCRREAALLKQDADKFAAAGATIVLVTMASVEDAAEFRARLKLPFVCLADPEQKAYAAFQVPRGSWNSVLGLGTWIAAFSAFVLYGAGTPKGDVKQNSGAFVIDRSGTIRFRQRAKNSADLPSHEAMLEACRAAR